MRRVLSFDFGSRLFIASFAVSGNAADEVCKFVCGEPVR